MPENPFKRHLTPKEKLRVDEGMKLIPDEVYEKYGKSIGAAKTEVERQNQLAEFAKIAIGIALKAAA